MSCSHEVFSRLVPLAITVALALQAAWASPARAQASPACFKVCSAVFYKHVGAVMKCASKKTTELAVIAECGTKAGA